MFVFSCLGTVELSASSIVSLKTQFGAVGFWTFSDTLQVFQKLFFVFMKHLKHSICLLKSRWEAWSTHVVISSLVKLPKMTMPPVFRSRESQSLLVIKSFILIIASCLFFFILPCWSCQLFRILRLSHQFLPFHCPHVVMQQFSSLISPFSPLPFSDLLPAPCS